MAWIYEITTGRLYSDSGELIGVGYSGAPEYKNDASSQSLHDLGPIPEGTYTVKAPEDTMTHGPYAMALIPDPSNLMWGRSGFLMHGDSVVKPGTASEGCVIMSKDVRQDVWHSNDHELKVVDILTQEAV